MDTIVTSIQGFNYKPKMPWQKKFQVKILDNGSGILKYECKLNNHWVLCEYEPKLDLLTYDLYDISLPRGKNTFEVKVTDLTQKHFRKNFSFCTR